uniref:Uncharacterized protein n=1 Tax=Oryza punctata TaxID=4537 RepID=A0A0E0M3A7_ORYPU
MGLSRRFQNLIVDCPGAKSLICVDLTRQLFGDTAAARTSSTIIRQKSELAKNKQVLNIKMGRIRLPSPSFTLQAAPNEPRRRGKIDCLPFADRKTLWVDHLDRPLLFDPEMHEVEFITHLHKRKLNPLSVFVPNAEADKDYENYCRGSSLFVMERSPNPELNWSTPWSDQFEAFVYCNPTSCPFSKSWVEYVPDLNLWFGFTSDESPRYLAAADLSSAMDMDSQPQLVTAPWKEDLLNNLPEEWKECKDSQLVYLGSGRFCILRFFHTHNQRNGGNVAVFTGVEVVPRVQAANGGSAGLELQMICHISLYHESDGTTIDVVL